MNNKYYKRSKISEKKLRAFLRYLAMDFTATDTAELTGLSRRSVTDIYSWLRSKIARWCEWAAPIQGTVEVDESYFGPKRVPGKRGRGAAKKTVVFGIFKRQGKVYTEIIPDTRKTTLQHIIRGKISLDSVIHSVGWLSCDGLVAWATTNITG